MNTAPKTVLHIDIESTIDPARQRLEVDARLDVPEAIANPGELSLWLHRELRIDEVDGPGVERVTWNADPDNRPSLMPEAARLDITWSEVGRPTNPVVRVRCAGHVRSWPEWSANVVTGDWVELGMYLPWFPYSRDHGPFTYDVRFSAPPAYEVRGLGPAGRTGTTWRFVSTVPTHDIVIAAGRSMLDVRTEGTGFSIAVHDGTPAPSIARSIAEDLAWIGSTYADQLGPPPIDALRVILSPRPRGGGYARQGLLVLGGIEAASYEEHHEAYVRYLGHELAHLWWHRADPSTWEDWLNESFAEYSALRAVRARYGNEALDRRLRDKRENLPDLPLWGFERDDRSTDEAIRNAEALLYRKGPLLLHELAQRLGERPFSAVWRHAAEECIETTAQFLDLLAEHAGPDVAEQFRADLQAADLRA